MNLSPKFQLSLAIFENKLESEAQLISEAIADIVMIAKMNDELTVRDLIRKQFLVINRQDLSNE